MGSAASLICRAQLFKAREPRCEVGTPGSHCFDANTHCCQTAVADVNRETGWNQLRLSRADRQGIIDTGTYVQTGRTVGRVVRQGYGFPEPRIQNLQFDRSQ